MVLEGRRNVFGTELVGAGTERYRADSMSRWASNFTLFYAWVVVQVSREIVLAHSPRGDDVNHRTV